MPITDKVQGVPGRGVQEEPPSKATDTVGPAFCGAAGDSPHALATSATRATAYGIRDVLGVLLSAMTLEAGPSGSRWMSSVRVSAACLQKDRTDGYTKPFRLALRVEGCTVRFFDGFDVLGSPASSRNPTIVHCLSFARLLADRA
jgi:hypothetical protein